MHNTTSPSLSSHNKVFSSARRALTVAPILLLLSVFSFPTPFAQEAAKPQGEGDARSGKTNNSSSEPRTAANANVTETLIDEKLADEPAVLKMLEPYRARVRELDTVIGRLEGELRKSRIGAGSLGNFVTDGLRAAADRKLGTPVAVTVMNSGGMRKNSIAEGELRVRDIFELLPFENQLIRIDMTGDQLLRLFAVVLAQRDAQSGARITYRFTSDDRPEFVSAKLIDREGREHPINPKAVYRVATIDYLYNLKSGNYSILGQGKDVAPLGITLRDALLNYVKTENAKGRPIRARMDNRFIQIGPNPQKAAAQ